jgi:hypothetical protein
MLDGIYIDEEQGPVFVPAPLMGDDDVRQIVQTAARRIIRLCTRRGLLDDTQTDPLADQEPLLAASVRGVIATGERAGQRLRRVRYHGVLASPFIVPILSPGNDGERSQQ